MAAPNNTRYIPYYHDILASIGGSLVKGNLWLVFFDDLNTKILPGIKKAISYEPEGVLWKVEEAAKIVTAEKYQKTGGCIYCHAIDLPGETIVANPGGNIVYNSFLRSYVGGGRSDLPAMRMTFTENSVSFADNFLRPWALSTATFGMIARDSKSVENYRTDMTCYQLSPYASHPAKTITTPTIIKTIVFKGICCISVNNEEYNYNSTNRAVFREAQFSYHSYYVDSETDNTLLQAAKSEPLS